MLDGYIRMMVHRFWEERRLTHPHLSVMYDITHEIIRIANLPEDTKEEFMNRLEKASLVKVGRISLDLAYLEAIYHRNINTMLDVDIETTVGSVTTQEIDAATKKVLRYMTMLVSDVGKLYYMDVQFKNINQKDDIGKVMEAL